jgi:hypothetical protein
MGDGRGSKSKEGQTADTTNVSVESKKISHPKHGYASARARSEAREVRGDVETGSGFKTLKVHACGNHALKSNVRH